MAANATLREERLDTQALLNIFGLLPGENQLAGGWYCQLHREPGVYPTWMDEDGERRGFEWNGWALEWKESDTPEQVAIFAVAVSQFINADPEEAHERACNLDG